MLAKFITVDMIEKNKKLYLWPKYNYCFFLIASRFNETSPADLVLLGKKNPFLTYFLPILRLLNFKFEKNFQAAVRTKNFFMDSLVGIL